MEKYRRPIIIVSAIVVLIAVVYWLIPREKHGEGLSVPDETVKEVDLLYGIDYTDLVVKEGTIENGQTISHIFGGYGVGPAMIDRTAKVAEEVYSLRKIRAGKNYTAFLTADSLSRLVHFVYEENATDYIVISYAGDSVSVRKEHKDVTVVRQKKHADINSSLWNAFAEAKIPQSLTMQLSDEIFAWSVDFFALQKGDQVTVIYDELFVEDVSVGVGKVWGAIFRHNGKDIVAIPFKENGKKITYWSPDGKSLRTGWLKAPLVYSRITSRFSNARNHPILKVVRPHRGVDYGAPKGTPVVAVADGTVIFKGWDNGGGGNTLKIKHSSKLTTGYLHLNGFASGITNGSRVSMGQTIGYVGSTGLSSGPHLDFRVWQNGTAIDPLKVVPEPTDPISKANMADFEMVRDRVMKELEGTLPDSMRITQLDSLWVYRGGAKPLAPRDPVQ